MFARGDDGACGDTVLSMSGVVIWDFEGTLAWRPGMWSGCVLDVLNEHEPDHTGSRDRLRADLKDGFPWHRAADPHPELCDPDAWWTSLSPLLARAFSGAGVDAGRHAALAQAVRARYVDGTVDWRVFDDTRPALAATVAAGWRNVILSNHVPELPALVSALGLDDLIEQVFTSALIGFDKPHPDAFRHALRQSGCPARRWMVGDNPNADIGGAQAVGIPAILVRTEGGAPDALAAARTITAT